MKKTTLFFCLLSMLAITLFGQNKKYVDSLKFLVKTMPDDTLKVGNYVTLHEQLMFSRPELALDYAKKALKLSKKLNYHTGIASCNIQIANYHYNKNQIDSAKYYYNKGLKIAKINSNYLIQIFANHSLAAIEKDASNYDEAIEIVMRNINLQNEVGNLKAIHDKIPLNLIGAEYELLGQIHLQKGNLHIAIKEALNALKFFENAKDEIREADALKLLGAVEQALQNYESSIVYSKKALNIYKKNNDLFYQSSTANQIGKSYYKQNNLDKAKTFFNEAHKLAEKSDAKVDKANAIEGLGHVFFKNRNYLESKKQYLIAHDIYEAIGFKSELANVLSAISKVEFESNNYNNSLNYINESISINKNIKANNNLAKGYQFRSKIYEKLNQTKSAITDLKQSRIINDSIFNSTKSQQIEELRTIYETEKKEQQIQIQKNEIDLLNIKSKVNKQQRLLLGMAFLLSLIGIYAFYLRNKKNKLAKEKAEANLEFKTKELTTHALHLAKKNETLNDLKQKAKALKADANADPGYQMLIQTINFDLQDDNNWENFSRYFEEVHKDFNTKAQQQFPNITTNDLRLMALLKMNLTSKEIANILNISSDGIKKARQRLRKKMGIDSNDSLEAIVIAI